MPDIVAAYWSPRAENASQGAQRVARFLEALAQTAPSPLTWFVQGPAQPGPADVADTTPEGLSALLEAGQSPRAAESKAAPEFGYRLGLWNGDRNSPVELRVDVAAIATARGAINSALLRVPSREGWRSRAAPVFTALVVSFAPDRALWIPRHERLSQPSIEGSPYVGWHTFLSQELARRVDDIPTGVVARKLCGGLWLKAGSNPDAQSIRLAAHLAEQLTG